MTILEFLRSILRQLAAMLIFPATLKVHSVTPQAGNRDVMAVNQRTGRHTLESLKDDITRMFRHPCTMQRMLSMSAALRVQYKAKLQESDACMLPSYCHTLPSGQEKGTYISLDMGGSTFRVALVELRGRYNKQAPMVIKRIATTKIDESIRKLPSQQFFDWMASRIHAMLDEDKQSWSSDEVLPLGLAWSFPIEQTSHRGGKMQGMGKGFSCHEDTIGLDLGELIESACARRNLKVRVDAIVNDSSATLLSQAYLDPSTSMALILGTGTNVAAYLPTSCMGRSKFGNRDPSWFKKAEKVITNTELSMFGKNILPTTRFDDILNRQHQLPDFQPIEYMTTGRYLGELLRLVIAEAVETGELFHGVMPDRLQGRYSLDTEILAQLEQDDSRGPKDSISLIHKAFALETAPTADDISFLRSAAEAISYRASAYIAVAVHALWALQKDTEINLTTARGTPRTSIASNGSVILKYPGFKTRAEGFIREMVTAGGAFPAEDIVFEPTDEAAVLGAAVAVALSDGP